MRGSFIGRPDHWPDGGSRTPRPATYALATALLLLASIGAAGAASGEHDHEGTILVGNGRLPGIHGVNHVDHFAPRSATGFDLHGDVHYYLTDACGGTGCAIRVYVIASAGAIDRAFGLDWAYRGAPADVVFGSSPLTDCGDLLCLT